MKKIKKREKRIEAHENLFYNVCIHIEKGRAATAYVARASEDRTGHILCKTCRGRAQHTSLVTEDLITVCKTCAEQNGYLIPAR